MTKNLKNVLAAAWMCVPVTMYGTTVVAADDPGFGYACDTCPVNWGNVSEDFGACSDGSAQSPIAIDTRRARVRYLRPPNVRFDDSALEVERLSTNFEAFVEQGTGSMTIGRKVFNLVQFHFHSKSEHVVNGERTALEMHYVHRNDTGELAVLGVFIKEGEHLDALDPVIDALAAVRDLTTGESVTVEDVKVADLLPRTRRSYRYRGSTTTPPCSESVKWILLARPIEMSAGQIDAIRDTLFEINDGFDNNRPIQERNGRTVKTDVWNRRSRR